MKSLCVNQISPVGFAPAGVGGGGVPPPASPHPQKGSFFSNTVCQRINAEFFLSPADWTFIYSPSVSVYYYRFISRKNSRAHQIHAALGVMNISLLICHGVATFFVRAKDLKFCKIVYSCHFFSFCGNRFILQNFHSVRTQTTPPPAAWTRPSAPAATRPAPPLSHDNCYS
jgi:hypothetical protein